MWSSLASFAQHVDCLCVQDDRVVAGLSELEGSTWSGAVCVVSGAGERLAFAPQEHGVSALAAHSSAAVVAGSDAGELRLMGSASLELYRSVSAHDSAVSALVVSGAAVVSAAWDGFIKTWDLSQPSDHPLQSIQAHSKAIHSLAQNPTQEHLLLSTSFDGHACLWDSRQRGDNECVLSLHFGGHIPTAADWHAQNQFQFATGFSDGSLRMYDVRQPAQPVAQGRVSKCRVSKLVWIQDVVALSAGTEMIFSTAREGDIVSKRFGGHHADYIRSFEVSTDEKEPCSARIFTASMDNSVGILDVPLAELTSSFFE